MQMVGLTATMSADWRVFRLVDWWVQPLAAPMVSKSAAESAGTMVEM